MDGDGWSGAGLELRRNRHLWEAGTFLALGLVFLFCAGLGGRFSPAVWLGIGGAVALVSVLIVTGVRPFRFHIGPDGLTLRHKGFNQLVPWHGIEALVLDRQAVDPHSRRVPGPHLLLVPAAGSPLGLPTTYSSPMDGRPAARLLVLDEVRQTPEEVAAALTRYAGGRFTDYRALRGEQLSVPDFTIALRGYDVAPVDRLIRMGQEALLSDQIGARAAALAEIERPHLLIAIRGYDRQQVNEFLDRLRTKLADG